MTRYLKLFASALLCVFTVGLMGCNDYTPNPEDDIALFQPFIDANINKKSDDPYISSTVKPGDKLYDILVNIQHGRHDVAIKQLKPLVEKGDADAQFWYAKMIFDSSVKNRYPALQLYKKSAEQGNPYAYFELSPFGEGCLVYFGESNCTQESLTKAIELFKQKAKQGDLRAQYFLLRMLKPDGSVIEHETYFSNNYNFTHSAETRQHYIKEVIRFAENHYYQPLMDYVHTLLKKKRPSAPYYSDTPKQLGLAKKLINIMVNNNYIPAINDYLYLNEGKLNKKDKIYNKLFSLGGVRAVDAAFYSYRTEYTKRELYYYAVMYEALTGSDKMFSKIRDYSPSKEDVYPINLKLQVSILESYH
ncbi:tetratricopeptide repeat protein [Vibrio rumoiensis]|uniref:tetratricopeptide repeat protein n=1 Tax=Vibrio rumoiensis TaxID=76258 RepID=UPI00374A93BD